MRSEKRVYLDANILIEAFEGGNQNGTQLVDLLAGNDGSRPAYLFTSELTLAEVLVQPLLQNNSDLVQSYDNLLNNSAILISVPVNRPVLWNAAALRCRFPSLKLPDAIHLSTAMSFRCTHFLSSDKRLAVSYELPRALFGDVAGPASLHVIRPNPETLDSLILEFAV